MNEIFESDRVNKRVTEVNRPHAGPTNDQCGVLSFVELKAEKKRTLNIIICYMCLIAMPMLTISLHIFVWN